MAKLPVRVLDLVESFGPHLNTVPPGGWSSARDPDRVVKTHCCFCGQQCGIQLKVKDNKVIGFEPWEDFPFNEGKLCPKGVKRYLQGIIPIDCSRPSSGPLERGFGRSAGTRRSTEPPPRSAGFSGNMATTPSPC